MDITDQVDNGDGTVTTYYSDGTSTTSVPEQGIAASTGAATGSTLIDQQIQPNGTVLNYYQDSQGNITTETTGTALPQGVSTSNSSPTGFVAANGAPVNADGTYYSTPTVTPSKTSTGATDTSSGSQSGVQGLLSGISKATGIPASILSPAGLTTAAGIAAMLGGNNTKTALSGSPGIPNLSYVNQQVPLAQAGQGQAFFTPGQYVDPSQISAARATANQQAQSLTQAPVAQAPLPAANVNTAWANQGKPVQAITPVTAPQQTGIAQVATPDQIAAIQAQVANLQQSPAQAQNLAQVHAAHGGMMPGGIAGMSHGGRYLQGTTDGMADKIDTSIDGVQPAKLSHGEFVIPADVVSHLGNGNSDAGAKKLYHMMDKIRMARTGTKKQGKEINPDKFMPGGIAGYASGGNVKHFATGATVANTATSPTSTPGLGTSTTQGLNSTFAPYITNMLGQEQALVNSGMPVYTGELTAGPSQLQNQYFANANQLAATGLTPTQFQSGTFDANAAAQYMNPYTQAALNPQLQALQLQAKQNEQGDLSKLTNAGAFGGTRQAVLQGQDAYNLLAQQAGLIGSGYNTAYTNAMNQFNTANSQSLQAQQNQEAANEAAANYGLAANQALGTAGGTQQGLRQAADTASLNQFNQQVQYPQTLLTDQASMLSGLPISAAATTPNTSTLSTIAGDLSGLTGIYQALGGQSNTSGSSGTTGNGSGSTQS